MKISKLSRFNNSGVVQSVARQPLELVILVRVQAPEPLLAAKFAQTFVFCLRGSIQFSRDSYATEAGLLRACRTVFNKGTLFVFRNCEVCSSRDSSSRSELTVPAADFFFAATTPPLPTNTHACKGKANALPGSVNFRICAVKGFSGIPAPSRAIAYMLAEHLSTP
jgi:hypothetical protein